MLTFFLVALLCKSSLQAVSPPNGQVIVLESKRLFSVSPNHISTGCTCHHCPGGCMYRAWQWLHLPPVPPWLPGGSHQEVPGGPGTAPAAPWPPLPAPSNCLCPDWGLKTCWPGNKLCTITCGKKTLCQGTCASYKAKVGWKI